MTSIQEIRLTCPEGRIDRKIRSRTSAQLPEADHQLLRRHLSLCERMTHSTSILLAHVLHHKIMTTVPVTNAFLGDVVTGGCRVIYSVNHEAFLTGLLVHRARSGGGGGVIPVASLLGATLIGMRVGQRAPLLGENGSIGTVKVLGVVPPV